MTDPAAKPRRGCFFYGCITGLVLLGLVLGALIVGLHYVKKLVNQYTDTGSTELPTVQMSQVEASNLKQRCETFQQAVREQRPVEPLTLTADDLNALIGNSRNREALKGKFYVSMAGDKLTSELSVPLREVGLSMFKGRYLNGNATFNLSFQNGVLSVTPQTITVKGKPLPEVFMQEIRKRNLATKPAGDPAAAALLKGLEDIQIKEGRLVVVPKEKK